MSQNHFDKKFHEQSVHHTKKKLDVGYFVLLINKTNGVEKTSRAGCQITYDYYYFDYEYSYNKDNYVLIKCVTDEEIYLSDIAKINLNLNSEGYSKSIKFSLTKENQDLTIYSKINEKSDYYDDTDDYNNNGNNNGDNNNEDKDIIDQIKDNSINEKNNTKGDKKDEDSITKTITAYLVWGAAFLAAITVGAVIWILVKQKANSVANATQQVGNEVKNIINNENIVR